MTNDTRNHYLVPNINRPQTPNNDPYVYRGAQHIVKKWPNDVLAMFRAMKELEDENQRGYKIFLATSPLRKLVWVAGAMKTLGWIEERPSENGACALVFTDKGRRAAIALASQAIR